MSRHKKLQHIPAQRDRRIEVGNRVLVAKPVLRCARSSSTAQQTTTNSFDFKPLSTLAGGHGELFNCDMTITVVR
ncbi:hypothetical protein PISMIDRAFT_687026 [Pisolithus microcarpus 441]|uniref:Uncharacterized protein n=1 Tax=Pisolithus microcarpus 441 TaxID=765257 RepID=A0A0C9Z704_9AGAM|nr:hypothetical protein PISMIDRAFT_687026 [Pisolithus microcarpus 441]